MALFQGTIRSSQLGMDTQLSVILPWDRPARLQDNPCKTLYLLHGLGDSATAWTRYTCVERYARRYGIAVVMPEVQRGFYSDMRYGLKYFSYVSDELPELCHKLFGLSKRRENNYVAGLSMGGYGAVKCGFACPEKYAGCASFSGVLDVAYIMENFPDGSLCELTGLLGNELEFTDGEDLFRLAEKLGKLPPVKRPKLLITCGTEDYLYKTNVAFKAVLDKNAIEYTYREWPGGHDWSFWDESIKLALKFFFGE